MTATPLPSSGGPPMRGGPPSRRRSARRRGCRRRTRWRDAQQHPPWDRAADRGDGHAVDDQHVGQGPHRHVHAGGEGRHEAHIGGVELGGQLARRQVVGGLVDGDADDPAGQQRHEQPGGDGRGPDAFGLAPQLRRPWTRATAGITRRLLDLLLRLLGFSGSCWRCRGGTGLGCRRGRLAASRRHATLALAAGVELGLAPAVIVLGDRVPCLAPLLDRLGHRGGHRLLTDLGGLPAGPGDGAHGPIVAGGEQVGPLVGGGDDALRGDGPGADAGAHRHAADDGGGGAPVGGALEALQPGAGQPADGPHTPPRWQGGRTATKGRRGWGGSPAR